MRVCVASAKSGPGSVLGRRIVSTWSLFKALLGAGFDGSSVYSNQRACRSIFELLCPLISSAPSRAAECEPYDRHAVIGVNELRNAEAKMGFVGRWTTGNCTNCGLPRGC